MAKALYVAFRDPGRIAAPDLAARLESACALITPDNITPRPALVRAASHAAYAVMNPARDPQAHDDSLALGMFFGDPAAWHVPGTPPPDGSYALFRADADAIEIASDPAGSRTIWYYRDDELFAAATSQRALVHFLGDFQFDERVIPWMLSTGTLGPGHSWDRRLKRLPPEAVLRIDRRDWTSSLKALEPVFAPRPVPPDEAAAALRRDLETLFGGLRPDPGRWALPLSGGYDSRALLCLLKASGHDVSRVRTLTWGTAAALEDAGSDATVARDVAAAFGTRHAYHATDLSDEPLETLIGRFLACGEGRADHLPGYMDGFAIWKTLFEGGVEGVLRGDEGFGWMPVSSPLTVRLSLNAGLCADYANLHDIGALGLPAQTLPEALMRRDGESLETWRDRLYHAYRLPSIVAALTDLKLGYVEQASPLLARGILGRVRTLPDAQRTGKALFRRVVDAMSPRVRFARRDSVASAKGILTRPDMVALMRAELESAGAREVFPEAFLARLLQGLKSAAPGAAPARGGSWKSALRALIPGFLKRRLRDAAGAPKVDGNVLAFRAFVVARMIARFRTDGASARSA